MSSQSRNAGVATGPPTFPSLEPRLALQPPQHFIKAVRWFASSPSNHTAEQAEASMAQGDARTERLAHLPATQPVQEPGEMAESAFHVSGNH